MNKDKAILLAEQAKKIDEVLNVLRTQFSGEFEDEVNYLEIVKANLAETSTK